MERRSLGSLRLQKDVVEEVRVWSEHTKISISNGLLCLLAVFPVEVHFVAGASLEKLEVLGEREAITKAAVQRKCKNERNTDVVFDDRAE